MSKRSVRGFSRRWGWLPGPLAWATRFLKSLAFLAASVSMAHAETYYVAREAAGASDSNDGRSPVFVSGNHGPWLTLSAGCQAAVAGDTVLVYQGDYRDEDTGWGVGVIPVLNSGTFREPIRIAAAVGALPVLHSMLVRNRMYIVIEGFAFTSREFVLPSAWQDMPTIVVDDPSVNIDPWEDWSTREAQVRQKYATYMSMLDFLTTDYTTGLDVKESHDIEIRNNCFSLYCFGVQIRGSSRITIANNSFSHCLDGIFSWTPAPAMTDSVISHNTIRQCFHNGMQIREFCERVLIEGNEVQYSGISHIGLHNGCQDCTVRANMGTYGGYYSETMVNPGSTAVNVHTSGTGILVERNLAAYQIDLTYLDGNGFFADLMRDGAGVIFRNNISFRNMGSGLRTSQSPNCMIVNNTFVQNGYDSNRPGIGAGIRFAQDSDINHVVLNNIFFDNRLAGIRSFDLMDQQRWIDYNLYYSNSGAPLIWDGGGVNDRAYRSLDEVRVHTGWEQNGREGNPLFVDLSGMDFRIRTRSPAIDAGATFPPYIDSLFDVADDFAGQRRPLGKRFDIGAFESY